jgi:MFS family permease
MFGLGIAAWYDRATVQRRSLIQIQFLVLYVLASGCGSKCSWCWCRRDGLHAFYHPEWCATHFCIAELSGPNGVSDIIPHKERPIWQIPYILSNLLGQLLGGVIGGRIVDKFGWRLYVSKERLRLKA